jgi:hypothetical protein
VNLPNFPNFPGVRIRPDTFDEAAVVLSGRAAVRGEPIELPELPGYWEEQDVCSGSRVGGGGASCL